MDLPLPLAIDAIGKAALAWRRARARGDDPGQALAAHRDVSCRDFYRDIGEAAERDPVARAARPWVAAMTLARVLTPDTSRLAEAMRAPTVLVERPVASRHSPREALALLLAEADTGRRRELAAALAAGAEPVADAARILAERRVEAARLLDAATALDQERPLPPAATTALARRILDATDAMHPPAAHWADALGRAMCREAAAGWPARLGARWLDEILAPLALTAGLALELPPLPKPLGAASFVRALRLFGRAVGEADVPRGAPLCVARAPRSVLAARRGALLASLPLDRVFSVRVLGLGRDAAKDHVRHLSRAALASLRLDAARVLLGDALLAPSARDRSDRFTETTAHAWGAALPPALLGVVPALGPDDATHLVASVLAARDRRRLVEEHDEDWFRSPRAGRTLRDEQQRSEALEPAATADDLDAALGSLLADLAERLG